MKKEAEMKVFSLFKLNSEILRCSAPSNSFISTFYKYFGATHLFLNLYIAELLMFYLLSGYNSLLHTFQLI